MSLRIHVRRCPRCGSALSADAGRDWLTCPGCPLALELGSAAPVATHRPEAERAAPGPRLAFWQFPATPRGGPIWVAGFRCFNQPQRPDVDRMLTELAHDPPLEEAPLGARLARGPGEARALATRWARPGPDEPRLVSLAARLEDGHVVEPVTGWRMLISLVRPWS